MISSQQDIPGLITKIREAQSLAYRDSLVEKLIELLESQPPQMDSERDDALRKAVAAIYFDDSSDYQTALWGVVQSLSPEVAKLLESNPKAAYSYVTREKA